MAAMDVEMAQVTEIDEALYSRQLYVLGHEAMRRMQGSNVLISGMAGIGVEIAKNVILTGVKSVTILDDSLSEFEDLGCNYYAEESKIGQPRSQVVLDSLAELNSYVKVSAMCGSLSGDIIKDYEVIVLCNASTAEQLKIGDITHYLGKKLICVNLFGLFGNIFCDFGKEFLVSDKNGEQPTSTIIQYISKEKESVVTCLEETRHNLETGDYVTFTEVEGMKELNNCEPIQITELGPYTFSIGDTTTLSDYASGGMVHEIKMPVTLKFKSLRESLSSPDFLISDFGKFDRPGQLLIGFQALDEYVTEKGHLPRSYNKEDAEHFISICEKMNSESAGHKVDALDKEVLMHLAYVCRGELMPMISTLGGIASQEVMKAATGKFTPIQQFSFFDALECLPKDQKDYPYDIQIKGKDRYARQKLIFGEEFHKQISNQRYFIVGSGALGCELLKNFSMMGVSSGEFGKIIVTDMDTIEKSNLNRQFLFRQGDVQSNKSSVATKAALKMNPDMNIVAHQNRVGPATEAVYNDAFFHDLTGVANALDNVDARIYMDRRCVYYRIPLLESGTLGTKGNVQVILPYITESYGSTSDPQDKDIPICTLKNFPNAIEHTLQWARDKFEGLFTQAPQNVLQYLSDPSYLERTLKLPGQEPYFILSEIRETFSKWPKNFQDCISYARFLFEEYFNSQICQLLYNFPSGHKTEQGLPFWSGTKRCPTPIVFSTNEVTHIDFVEAAALLFAEVYNISTGEMDRAKIALLIDNVIVPKFEPKSGVKIAVTDQEAQAQIQPTSSESELKQLIDSFPKISEVQGKLQIQPIDFEKDDDSNHHMDFIVACSNHRATNYSIPTADKHKSKGIAGKIIPAIATTTAAIVGLVCLEFYKVVRDRDNYKKIDIADYKNAFINLALPFFGFSEPIPAPIIKYFDNEFTLWDRLEIDGRRENGEMTLGEFKKHFEDMKIKISMISQGVALIYSFFLNPQKAAERFALPVSAVVEQVVKEPIPPHQTSIVLEMCCEDLEGNDLEIPYIKYDFR